MAACVGQHPVTEFGEGDAASLAGPCPSSVCTARSVCSTGPPTLRHARPIV
jgi:hypothetical protein